MRKNPFGHGRIPGAKYRNYPFKGRSACCTYKQSVGDVLASGGASRWPAIAVARPVFFEGARPTSLAHGPLLPGGGWPLPEGKGSLLWGRSKLSPAQCVME